MAVLILLLKMARQLRSVLNDEFLEELSLFHSIPNRKFGYKLNEKNQIETSKGDQKFAGDADYVLCT